MPNYYYPPYYQQPQLQNMQQPQAQPQQMPQPQIQNGGFVSVRGEQEARAYPVAPGNSITFKDETAPYVYTKTMGFSQLDRPIFEKFKLVKEQATETSNLPQNENFGAEAMSDTIKDIKAEIETIWGEIEGLKKKAPGRPKKKEVEEDDE